MQRTRITTAILAVAALTLTACGGGETESTTADAEGRAPADSGQCTEDNVGGTITMGEYVMLPSFAPGQGQYGVRGSAGSAAVYDRLMRWDPASAEFEPKLAESLESNADNTVWTLTLRDGVSFSNGDPLTAEDVAFTLGLHQDPASQSTVSSEAGEVDEVTVVDPLTVEYTLTEPWAGFPFFLAGAGGEVIPEQAYQASGPEEWARAPIGAGAFVVDNYIPDQELTLRPNEDYYGGTVCPDLRFIRIPGSQSTLEAVQTGEIQLGFLRGPRYVADAVAADIPGFHETVSSGSIINMNTGAAGYDGVLTDVRAREAVAHAIDRNLLDQRLTGGVGHPASALLTESSRFNDGQNGPSYDTERATRLVDELKAERPDWDGRLTMLVGDGPENVESGVTTKALLDAVGFDVTIENAPVSQVTARQFTGDFEIVLGGLGVSEADPASAFASAMTPGGSTNITGVDDPELTEAIADLKAAGDPEAQTAAFTRLQEVHNSVLPFTVVANGEQYVTVDESVSGVVPSLASTMLFDGAYVTD